MAFAIRFSEESFKVMKLREVLIAAGISNKEFGAAIMQASGKPMSHTAVSLLLGHEMWPKTTPRQSVERQIREFLARRGLAAADDTDLFSVSQEIETPPRTVGVRSRPRFELVSNTDQTDDDQFHLEPVMLSPQAKRHFKLFRDPFNTDPDSSEDVFRGPDQQYASESIWEAVRNSRLFALVGESGSGKTTLMDDFRDRVRREGLPVRLIQPMLPEKQRLTGIGILEAIVRDLAPDVKPRRNSEGLSRQAHELLAESAEAGMHNVVIFEEAHDLSIHALKQLKRFHEFKTGWKRLLAIVLVGQPELLTKLGEHATGEAREVARRLEILQLLPLDNELDGYVAHKLARVSAKTEAIFASDVFDAVRGRLRNTVKSGPKAGEGVSMAYPLLVNNLLVKALNTAAELGAERVDGALVRGC